MYDKYILLHSKNDLLIVSPVKARILLHHTLLISIHPFLENVYTRTWQIFQKMCKLNRNIFISSNSKLKPIFITEQDEEEHFKIENLTKQEIRNQIQNILSNLEVLIITNAS